MKNAQLPDAFLQLSRSGDLPAYREISNQLRTLIRDGTLPPGFPLPSTKELARHWGVFPTTVQTALEPLVKEGLLDRRLRHGTFVRHEPPKLARLGIYENFSAIPFADRDFLVSLQVELATVLHEQEAELKIWTEVKASPKSLPTNLVEACRKREIDGIITMHPSVAILNCLAKLPVPSAVGTCMLYPSRIDFDYRDLVTRSVERLATTGARRLAVISNVIPDKTTEINNPCDVSHFYEFFTETAARLGLETSPAWTIRHPGLETGLSIERFGYEAIHRMWRERVKPDGLFIYPHTCARGALLALLELGVKVPGDLTVVAHENIETPILTPLPVDWISSSCRQIATEMVSMIERSLRGEKAVPVFLNYAPAWESEEAKEKGS